MLLLPILKRSGKVPVLGESFTHLHRFCGNVLFSVKIPKVMSVPDDSVSSNIEITSSSSLGVTGQREKDLTVMYLLLGRFLY